MSSVLSDLLYLQGAADNLESYLLSEALSWPIGVKAPSGEAPLPPLSLESLLLAQQKLTGREACFSPVQRAEFYQINRRLDELRSRWRVAWERKASCCFGPRLRLWRNYLEDYRQQPEAHADRFVYEVRQRVMLHLLSLETTQIASAQYEDLAALDALLKQLLTPADFIWEADLRDAFPPEIYWYLYGVLLETPVRPS